VLIFERLAKYPYVLERPLELSLGDTAPTFRLILGEYRALKRFAEVRYFLDTPTLLASQEDCALRQDWYKTVWKGCRMASRHVLGDDSEFVGKQAIKVDECDYVVHVAHPREARRRQQFRLLAG
jgi:hypothetical protein